MAPRSKSLKKKKPPTQDLSKEILALRDKLIADGHESKEVHEACQGLYKCDKTVDQKCLDGIMKKLKAFDKKKVGGARKVRKTRSKSRSRSRSRSRR
jgi:hypothetical protein